MLTVTSNDYRIGGCMDGSSTKKLAFVDAKQDGSGNYLSLTVY
jgi:hypothetical protein